MRAKIVLWRIAILCAVLLLVAPMTPRTSWTYAEGSEMRAEGGGMTSAGWDWVALLAGFGALVRMFMSRWLRPGIIRPVLCATIAAMCLGVAAAAALGHWLDLMSGSLAFGERWVIHPAPAVAYFAGIAAAGLVATLVLLGSWLRPSRMER